MASIFLKIPHRQEPNSFFFFKHKTLTRNQRKKWTGGNKAAIKNCGGDEQTEHILFFFFSFLSAIIWSPALLDITINGQTDFFGSG